MENMLPGNSFPQICVVSVNNIVENEVLSQDYGRSVDISNPPCLLISNPTRTPLPNSVAIAPPAVLMAPVGNAGGLQQIGIRQPH